MRKASLSGSSPDAEDVDAKEAEGGEANVGTPSAKTRRKEDVNTALPKRR